MENYTREWNRKYKENTREKEKGNWIGMGNLVKTEWNKKYQESSRGRTLESELESDEWRERMRWKGKRYKKILLERETKRVR